MRILSSLTAALLLVHGSVQAAGDIDAGKAKSAPCAACHGADGNSPTTAFPILAGQYQDYLMRAMEDYQTGKRNNPIMTGFAAPLTKQDRADLAAYFSSQKSSLYTVEYSD
ncbi:MAG: c-type cytochrome [Gammaproteobacteria bacterium]|jgi:cytochrome c553|nr:c-type cytochrome [Gammaproteobacteria bacterium]